MHRIHPQHGLRLFHRFDIEVDRNRLAVAAHQHAFERFVAAGMVGRSYLKEGTVRPLRSSEDSGMSYRIQLISV